MGLSTVIRETVGAVITKYGSRGKVEHLIGSTTDVTNAYDENGIPYSTVTTPSKFEVLEVDYIASNIKFGSKDEALIKNMNIHATKKVSIKYHVSRNTISKRDIFESQHGERYSIEYLQKLGDIQGEISFIILYCKEI